MQFRGAERVWNTPKPAAYSATRTVAGSRQPDGRSLRVIKMALLVFRDKENIAANATTAQRAPGRWICGQHKRVAHNSTAATSAEEDV
jgi:hypothetical protein